MHTRSLRPWAAALTAVLAALPLTAGAAAHGAPAPVVARAATVTATFTAATVPQFETATLTAVVPDAIAARKVALQRLDAGRWVQVAAATLDSSRRHDFAVPTPTQGTFSYRAVALTATHRPASTTRTLTVQQPLRGPFLIAMDPLTHSVIRQEALGGPDRHGRLLELHGDLKGLDVAPNGRMLAAALTSDSPTTARTTITVTGAGLPDLTLGNPLVTAHCFGWDDISADGRLAVYGLGDGSYADCATPTSFTVVDTTTGAPVSIDNPAPAESLLAPQFSRDGRYLLVLEYRPSISTSMTRIYDTTTGALLSSEGATTIKYFQPTDLPSAPGTVVLSTFTTPADCPSGLYVFTLDATTPRHCWTTAELPGQQRYGLAVSPDGTQVAWTKIQNGTVHMLLAPADDLTAARDLGGPGYTPRTLTPAPVTTWIGDNLVRVTSGRQVGGRAADTGALVRFAKPFMWGWTY